eukprot:6218369-Amphidinium_carterae.1
MHPQTTHNHSTGSERLLNRLPRIVFFGVEWRSLKRMQMHDPFGVHFKLSSSLEAGTEKGGGSTA